MIIFLTASFFGHLPIVKFLLSVSNDINAITDDLWDYSTPLHFAAENGKLDVVEYLVQKGANINAKTGNGKTAYDLAVENGHWNVADYLNKQM